MYTFKRILSLMLSLLLSTSVLLSCAADKTEEAPDTDASAQTENTPAETGPALPMDDLGDADFEGASYIIGGTGARTTTAITSAELNGEVINDAQYNSARAVEERFNVKISYEDLAVDDAGTTTVIKGLVAGNDDTYAVTFNVDTDQITLALSGHYMNLKAVPQFNFDKPWWIDSTDTISLGDKAYVASSYLSYYCLYYIRVLTMNKDMAADLGIEVPYEQVFEGDWYLDDLIELASLAAIDLNGDGTMTADDQYGLTYEVLYTMQSSMGIKIIDKDKDNIPFLAFDIDRATTYLEKIENLCDNYGFYEVGYGANMFANNKSLFCYCNLREICNIIRDSEISYGYLPAPKLDEQQEDYMTVATDVYWGIPVSVAGKMDMVGTITEALSCQHFNNVRPAFFETTMKSKLAGDENDMKVLDLVAERLSIDFAFAYQKSLGSVTSLDDLYRDNIKSGNVASKYESFRSAIEQKLVTLVETFQDLP
ncbi:MAG: hypothetical protein IKY52_06350 [Clostridia bacterium]|nr:hypothetical protein [Clostridia bacterium]